MTTTATAAPGTVRAVTAPDRHRTASDDVRTALLDAAERVLDRDGIAKFTIRTVATEAQVAPMGVYSRFRNKDGLLTALAGHAFAALVETMRTGDAPAPQRLREICRRYRAFALGHPARYRLMFSPSPEGTRPLAAATSSGLPAFDVLIEAVDALPEGHRARHLSSTEAAQILWEAIHGAVTIEQATLMRVPDPDRHFELLLDVTLAGLGHTGDPQPRTFARGSR